MNDDAQAIYLFCFARSDPAPAIEGKGIDGQSPLFLHTAGDIGAVVSTISLGELSGPEAEARMRDLEWIGPRALRHEQVIEQVMLRSPVFPARFGTLFSAIERLDELVIKNHDTISHFLNRMAHREEWAVKTFLDRKKAREEYITTALAANAQRMPHSAGARYLQEQRIRTGADKELNRMVKAIGEELWKELNRIAEDVKERRVLPSGGEGDIEGEMVLNWAFLVPRENLPAFKRQIDGANASRLETGLVFHCSGPWPPFSFTPNLSLESET
jgi:hypothetical protein